VWREAVKLLDTIPGVDRQVAEVMLAEMGLDMSQFPTADHLASWAARPHQGHVFESALPSPCCPPGQQTRHCRYCAFDTGQCLGYVISASTLLRACGFYDQRKKESKINYHIRRLQKLTGCTVSVEMQPAIA